MFGRRVMHCSVLQSISSRRARCDDRRVCVRSSVRPFV